MIPSHSWDHLYTKISKSDIAEPKEVAGHVRQGDSIWSPPTSNGQGHGVCSGLLLPYPWKGKYFLIIILSSVSLMPHVEECPREKVAYFHGHWVTDRQSFSLDGKRTSVLDNPPPTLSPFLHCLTLPSLLLSTLRTHTHTPHTLPQAGLPARPDLAPSIPVRDCLCAGRLHPSMCGPFSSCNLDSTHPRAFVLPSTLKLPLVPSAP